jgi:hypothetical protein
MNPRLLLAGVLVIVIVAVGSFRLVQITGSAAVGGENQKVQVVIDYGDKVTAQKVILNPRETAFDALKRVATTDYIMQLPNAIITEINGIRQDGIHHWVCTVNGKMPEEGCDYYYPVTGDEVKFSYVKTG